MTTEENIDNENLATNENSTIENEDLTTIKYDNNTEKSNKRLATEKSEELFKWKIKNSTQKWFFSLEEREQNLLEKTYIVFVQVCPQLTREDYLDRLRKSDQYSNATKAIIKKVVGV